MSYSAPLEMLADAVGSVTFGWADEGVYYARFSRCLSGRLGEAFAGRLRAAVETSSSIKYFADGRALESYDLLARSAFVRVVTEHRRKFEQLTLLWWSGTDAGSALVSALGRPLFITKDAVDFETLLMNVAPRGRCKLGVKPESPHGTRWPLRR
jgi:hypothetical protein